MWYFNAVSQCRFQTYISNIRTVIIQMLIWRHICFAMASLIAQCTFKIVNVSQQRCPCICFDKVAIITIYIQFTTVTFWSYDFQWLPIFSAFISGFPYVSGFSQLNWPWHSKQCSVAPELSHLPFKLSCSCSIVLVITFFFVSPMYSALQLQFMYKRLDKNEV